MSCPTSSDLSISNAVPTHTTVWMGELSVTDVYRNFQRFVDACVALGYDRNPDFNAMQQSERDFSVNRQGWEAAQCCCCLPCHSQRPNLTTTGALVTRLFEGTHTVGVEYLHEGAPRVNQEVILGGHDRFAQAADAIWHWDAKYLQAFLVSRSTGCGSKPTRPSCRSCGIQGNGNLHFAITSSVAEAGLFFA